MTTYKLNNGLDIPAMGLGVWKMREGGEVENAVKWALQTGYRLIDTAKIYGNESGVGQGIRDSGIPREEVFVTTKLWNSDQGYDSALRAIDESLERLGMDYVDLYLIHWPTSSWPFGSGTNKRAETWRAMEEIYKSGKARAIGVSNYTIKHLSEMEKYAKVPPVVNQVEFHPFLYQAALLDYCKQHNIILEAYSPLARGTMIGDDSIAAIADKYNKSPAQIVLRWSLQHGCLPIPKSTSKERIEQNFSIFDFELSEEDMLAINALGNSDRLSPNPEEVT